MKRTLLVGDERVHAVVDGKILHISNSEVLDELNTILAGEPDDIKVSSYHLKSIIEGIYLS